MKYLPGFDVSNNNGGVGWHSAKAQGYAFAGIKATEGLGFHDPLFPYNWHNARNANFRRIAYHFNHPEMDGNEQANYFHQYIHDNGHLQIGDAVALDIETIGGVSPSTVVHEAEAFVRNILKETQAGIYIYVGYYFWRDTLGNPESPLLAKCAWWLPSYGEITPNLDNWPSGPSIWQYSETGRIPGIQGDVDLDRFLGTTKQYDTLARKAGRT